MQSYKNKYILLEGKCFKNYEEKCIQQERKIILKLSREMHFAEKTNIFEIIKRNTFYTESKYFWSYQKKYILQESNIERTLHRFISASPRCAGEKTRYPDSVRLTPQIIFFKKKGQTELDHKMKN